MSTVPVPPVATISTTMKTNHHGGHNHAIINAKRNDISEKELSECDREKLHLLGHIQGDSGNVLFFSYPEGRILAADNNIRNISWIRKRGSNKKMRSASYSGSASVSVSSSTTGGSVSTTAASPKWHPFPTMRNDSNVMKIVLVKCSARICNTGFPMSSIWK